jgi:hypothetical protein
MRNMMPTSVTHATSGMRKFAKIQDASTAPLDRRHRMKVKPEVYQDEHGNSIYYHDCYLNDNNYTDWGHAVTDCFEDAAGHLFVGNAEYGTQVNYCPQCGYKARIQHGSNDNT